MNPVPIASCDVCFGSDLLTHRAAAACRRPLVLCASCGLVTAAEPCRQDAPSRLRDAVSDARRAAAVSRLLPAGRVLEIGCSEGRFLEALDPSRYVAFGLETCGETAGRAAQRLRVRGQRGVVVAGSLMPPVSMEPESFDLVVLFGALERAASPRVMLREAVRLLRNGGQALIETHSNASLTARLMGARWAPLSDPLTAHIFSPGALEHLAATCGLFPARLRTALPLGWPRPGSVVYVARKTSETLRVPELGLAVARSDAAPLGAA